MKGFHIILFLPVLLLIGCSDKTSEPTPVEAETVETIPPAEENYDLPHLLLFGEEEGMTVVSDEFVKDQTDKINNELLTEYSQEEIDDLGVDNYIGGLINERLHSAVAQEIVGASDEVLETLDAEESTTLKGVFQRRKSTDSQVYTNEAMDKVGHTAMVASTKTATADNIKQAVKNQVNSTFDNDEIGIPMKTSVRYKIWRILQAGQGLVQRQKITDQKYFEKAIKVKKAQSDYSKFDQMGEIKVSSDLAKKIDQQKVSDIESNLRGKGSAITLGMLPKKGLLEDIDRNNHARNNIRASLGADPKQADAIFKEIDQMKSAMLRLDADEIKAIREGTSDESALVDSYNNLKTKIDEVALEDALDSHKMEAEKRLEKAIDQENLAKNRSKLEGIDYKNTIQDTIDKLRQSLLVLTPAQMQKLRAQQSDEVEVSPLGSTPLGSTPFDLTRLDLTPDQEMVVNSNGEADGLAVAYKSFKSTYANLGDKVIDNIIMPREIAGYTPNTKNMSVATVVEEFELEAIVPTLKTGLDIKTAVGLGEGRYRIPVKTDKLKEALGVEGVEMTQFATRDRTMMTPKLLSRSIDYVNNAVDKGRQVFVHCKSGKGRSATVVVGSRVDRVIAEFNAAGVTLTKAEIVNLIGDQVDQVRQKRPMISVSPPQRTVLADALVLRQFSRQN
ncbi:MAG: hypothetical protein OXE99_15455 [Cellvibrionales bacterium]|nr:hypothetical protein [Cellvibrionales bacterium]